MHCFTYVVILAMREAAAPGVPAARPGNMKPRRPAEVVCMRRGARTSRPDGSGGSATIVIRRDHIRWRDKLRAYKILVDGRPVGSVRRGGTREITVPPGPHTVQLRIDWCTSPAVDVNVDTGRRAVLECGPGGKAPDMLAAITAGRDRYIRLEPAVPGPTVA